WVVPSLAGPVPAPGLVGTSVRWMLRPESPLYVRPRADPGFVRWLLGFWRRCNRRDHEAGFAAVGELGRQTLALYDALRAAGVEFEEHRTGLVYAYRQRAALEHDFAALGQLRPFGYRDIALLDGAGLRELEPALAPGLAGGYWIERDRHLRPDSLVRGLREWLRRAAVEIRSGVTVTGFDHARGRVRALGTSDGVVPITDAVVVCAGVWTGPLLRRAGVRVPIEMGKGYSLDFVPSPLPEPVRHALYLHEDRVAITPLAGRLRLAGTMELSGLNHQIEPRRVAAIARAGAGFLRDWPEGATPDTVWAGGRPMTPDGLPVIGLAPGFGNLAIASGHAMLGVTLAPATAEAIAELLTTGAAPAAIAPFRADRFGWL
ncbi:MAG: FAD-dependent oxidoreductase, partial [Chloroflexota bacterium]|nr:FAD-dependent oxidoreductase [Chloroflexota bacterium]